MCDPVTAIVGGTILKGVGSVMAGDARKKAAYDEASGVELEARMRAKNIRKLATEVRAEARADYAGSGVMVDEGSPLVVDAYITRESELDALNTILSGELRAKSLRKSGKAAQKAGYIDAADSALGGYGDWASLGT